MESKTSNEKDDDRRLTSKNLNLTIVLGGGDIFINPKIEKRKRDRSSNSSTNCCKANKDEFGWGYKTILFGGILGAIELFRNINVTEFFIRSFLN